MSRPLDLFLSLIHIYMPATKLEEEIAAVWKEVLELDEIPGVTDSFFDLGGDSLLASMAITKIRGKVDRAREEMCIRDSTYVLKERE